MKHDKGNPEEGYHDNDSLWTYLDALCLFIKISNKSGPSRRQGTACTFFLSSGHDNHSFLWKNQRKIYLNLSVLLAFAPQHPLWHLGYQSYEQEYREPNAKYEEHHVEQVLKIACHLGNICEGP